MLTEFVISLDAHSAVCQHLCGLGRLGDVRGKVLDSSGNAKSFDFAGEPGDLMFLQFGVKEASE